MEETVNFINAKRLPVQARFGSLLGDKGVQIEQMLFSKYFPLRSENVMAVITSVCRLHSTVIWRHYLQHVRGLVWNLENGHKITGNAHFIVYELRLKDLAPALWKGTSFKDSWLKDDPSKDVPDRPVEYTKSAMKCNKCGKREIEYTQLQTRSGDEGFTTYFHCLKCGNRWKTS